MYYKSIFTFIILYRSFLFFYNTFWIPSKDNYVLEQCHTIHVGVTANNLWLFRSRWMTSRRLRRSIRAQRRRPQMSGRATWITRGIWTASWCQYCAAPTRKSLGSGRSLRKPLLQESSQPSTLSQMSQRKRRRPEKDRYGYTDFPAASFLYQPLLFNSNVIYIFFNLFPICFIPTTGILMKVIVHVYLVWITAHPNEMKLLYYTVRSIPQVLES